MQRLLTGRLFQGAVIYVVLLHFNLSAQDIHFSQFYASPLTLNPANTGLFNGDWRAAGIYRDQWRAISPAMMTAAASFDKIFTAANQTIGAGVVLAHDRSGEAKLNVTKIFLSGAYHRGFGKHTLSGGLQMGFVDKRIDNSAITFPQQWNNDEGQFDSQIPHQDQQIGDKLKYFDVNAGLSWSVKTKKVEPQVGASFFHIIRPRESFFKNKEKLPVRSAMHAGLKWNAAKRFFLWPNFLYQFHSGAREFLLGSNFGYRLSDDKLRGISVWAGPMFRHGLVAFKDDPNDFSNRTDAIIAIAGFGYKNLEVGFAYDVNISDLKNATNNKGAFEISVIYISSKPKLDKEQIPCERL